VDEDKNETPTRKFTHAPLEEGTGGRTEGSNREQLGGLKKKIKKMTRPVVVRTGLSLGKGVRARRK